MFVIHYWLCKQYTVFPSKVNDDCVYINVGYTDCVQQWHTFKLIGTMWIILNFILNIKGHMKKRISSYICILLCNTVVYFNNGLYCFVIIKYLFWILNNNTMIINISLYSIIVVLQIFLKWNAIWYLIILEF